MFWGKAKWVAVLMAGGLALGAPALAETLVVRASGPSASGFPAGKKLPDGGSVALKAGDMLTLLDGRGTRTLRGPGTFPTNAAATGGTQGPSFANFLGTNSRARTGAVRNAKPRPGNLWYVDSTKSSTICVADPANVKLWRPSPVEAATLTVAGQGKGAAKGSIAFEPGLTLADWPAALPVTEGATYQLSGGGLAAPVTLRFTLLPADADGLENTAATLIARKCDAQLNALIDAVTPPDAPAPN